MKSAALRLAPPTSAPSIRLSEEFGGVIAFDRSAVQDADRLSRVFAVNGAGSMAEKMLKEQQARLHVTGGRTAQWIEVKQLSPTLESFSDWAGPALDPFGERIAGQDEIPNDNLDNRREKTTLRDRKSVV